jgi:hypothetical protein
LIKIEICLKNFPFERPATAIHFAASKYPQNHFLVFAYLPTQSGTNNLNIGPKHEQAIFEFLAV